MRFLYAIFIIFILFLIHPSCFTYVPVPLAPSIETSNLLLSNNFSSIKENKNFSEYIKVRTVSVKRDCQLIKKATSIQEDYLNKAYDFRGTGVIIRSWSGRSYILTANHIFNTREKPPSSLFNCKAKIQRIKDINTNKGYIYADIILSDNYSDLLVLKVYKNLGVNTQFKESFVGENIWSSGLGNLRTLGSKIYFSITSGVLASELVDIPGHGTMSRVTSQVFLGSSGGPVWDFEGNVVGTVQLLLSTSVFNTEKKIEKVVYEGSYYIKPIDSALELIISKGKFKEVFLRSGILTSGILTR